MNAADVVSQRIAAGDYYGALQEIERLEGLPRKCLDPQDRQLLLFESGRARLHMGDYHLAEEALREFIAEVGTDGRGAAQALMNLGLAMAQQGRQSEALRHWERALQYELATALRHAVRHARAWALVELLDLDAARREVERMRTESITEAQQLDVLLCTAFERLRAMDHTGSARAALQILEHPAATTHQRSHGLWLAAEAALVVGDLEGSRGLLAEAQRLATAPLRPWLLNQLGRLRRRLDEKERGVS